MRAFLFSVLLFLVSFCASLAAHGQGLTSYWNTLEHSEHVFFVGTDQQIHEMYYIKGRWHHGSTGAPLGALTVMSRSPLVGFFDGNQHVFYVASDPLSKDGASLRELYYDARGWHTGNPNGAARSGIEPANYAIASGGAVTLDGYAYGMTGFWDGAYEHVFAVTNNIHMSEFYKNNNSKWNYNSLKVAANNGRPYPSVPMTGFYDFTHSVEHVFYIGETSDPNTQHLYELYYNGQWRPNDLTASGAPAPSGHGTGGLMGFTDDAIDHVFYSTQSGSLIEMTHLATGGHWTHKELPVPTGAGALTGFDDGAYQHVFFIGFDGHVHEMYRLHSTGAWQTNDLTTITSSSSPACGISSFYDGRVEHVFYVGEDSHVHELYYNGRWWHNDLTRGLAGQGAPDAEICSEPNGDSQ